MDAAAGPAAVGARPVHPGAARRSRSSTRRASVSASSRSSARTGRSCRPPPASSIRCCRPVSRSRSLAFNDLRTRWRASARPRPGLLPASSRPPPGLFPGSAGPRPGLCPGSPGHGPGAARVGRVREADAGRAGCDGAAGRRALRVDGRLRGVQAADDAVFRGGELLGGGAAARAPGTGAGVPPARGSPLRAGAPPLRRVGPHHARRVRGPPRRARRLFEEIQSRHRAVRHRRPARSQPARLVSGSSPPISSPARPSWAPRPRRSACCSPQWFRGRGVRHGRPGTASLVSCPRSRSVRRECPSNRGSVPRRSWRRPLAD